MAHYAFLDENNIVTEVIVGVDENLTQIDTDGSEVGGSTEAWETFYGNLRGQVCKRTSYTAWYGKKRNMETYELTEESAFRKNYAIVGGTYDAERDAFISPKPYPSWVFNEDICVWEAPISQPDTENPYLWNEETGSWDLLVI